MDGGGCVPVCDVRGLRALVAWALVGLEVGNQDQHYARRVLADCEKVLDALGARPQDAVCVRRRP